MTLKALVCVCLGSDVNGMWLFFPEGVITGLTARGSPMDTYAIDLAVRMNGRLI